MPVKRHTVQKTMTYKATRELCNHPTAEEIYEKVRITCPNISLGTVYRNLNVLCDEGLLLHISGAGNADRYDHTITPHYHLRCKKCGSVTDSDMPYNENFDSDICKSTGFTDLHHDVIFTGICPECSGKE